MKKLIVLSVLAAAFSGLSVASTAVTAAAAETHGACIQFDSQGNPIPGTQVPNCTETVTLKDVGSMSEPGQQNPCNPSQTGTFTMTIRNEIDHVNVNGDGDMWLASTQSGTASFVPDDGSASYSGPMTGWFGMQVNNKTVSGGGTFHVNLSDGLGDSVVMHQVGHFTQNPNGSMGFQTGSLACG